MALSVQTFVTACTLERLRQCLYETLKLTVQKHMKQQIFSYFGRILNSFLDVTNDNIPITIINI